MKKKLFLAFLFGISQFGFSQQNTDYQYIIIPKQFSFQKEVNQFNLNILSKFLLEKNNFKCVWDDKIPENSNSCDGLRFNIINNSNLLKTKLIATLTACKGNVVYTSQEGKSGEKDFKKGYSEALRKALANTNSISMKKITPDKKEDNATYTPDNPIDNIKIQESNLNITKLTLKEIENKIILINENNEEVFSLQKTSLENMYQALRKKDNVSGIFFKKDNHFIFEYNKNGNIIHDFYDVTF